MRSIARLSKIWRTFFGILIKTFQSPIPISLNGQIPHVDTADYSTSPSRAPYQFLKVEQPKLLAGYRNILLKAHFSLILEK